MNVSAITHQALSAESQDGTQAPYETDVVTHELDSWTTSELAAAGPCICARGARMPGPVS